MSGLLKAGAAHTVRPFLHGPAACLTAGSAEREQAAPAEDPRLSELRGQNQALREALAQSAVTLDRAKIESLEAGRRETIASFQREDAKRIEALDAGISAAVEDWQRRLAELDGLAALIGSTALAKIFEEPAIRSEIVLDMIARQIRHLRRETVLAVRVSPVDFPDAAALEAVSARAATGSVSIIADPDLQGGDCRLDLQLGHVDIGPRAQWAQLADLLRDMAAEDLPA